MPLSYASVNKPNSRHKFKEKREEAAGDTHEVAKVVVGMGVVVMAELERVRAEVGWEVAASIVE